jgi:hypothetical protein
MQAQWISRSLLQFPDGGLPVRKKLESARVLKTALAGFYVSNAKKPPP